MDTIVVTDAAALRVINLLKNEGYPDAAFRIEVQPGGCSGMSYKFHIDPKPPGALDLVVEKNGARVVIDDLSLGFMKGATLDYVETLAEAEFTITNPNSTARCGCGNSFSVM